MVRFGLVVVVIGLLLYAPVRRRPTSGWRQRAVRVLVVGLCVVWVGAMVAIGVFR